MKEAGYPTFGDVRRIVSRIDRVSMVQDDMSYEKFARVDDVPPKYDRMVVKGIGIIDSEFPAEGDLHSVEARERAVRASKGIASAVENLEDVAGREGEKGAEGLLSSALGHIESAGDALLEACGVAPTGPVRPLDWALALLAVARDCTARAAAQMGMPEGGPRDAG